MKIIEAVKEFLTTLFMKLFILAITLALCACGADPGPDHDPEPANVPIRGPVPIDVTTDCSPKVTQCT